MRFGKRLVFVNPTVIPTMFFKVRRLERCWFSQIQLSIQPLPLMYKGWKTVGFRQSNRHSNHVLQGTKVGTRLVFAKPTVIPTVDFKIRKFERSWFSQNQPTFQPEAMIYEGWNVVGFRKTNRHYNHGLQYTKVGTRLVFAKPTVIPTMGYDIRKLERGWFLQNQPPFQPSASISEG